MSRRDRALKSASRLLLALTGCAAFAAGQARADEASFGLFWQGAPSHWIDAGRRLFGEEIGKPVGAADVLVAYVDVNGDTIGDLLVYPINPSLCAEAPCKPRLYAFVDATYTELIAGAAGDTAVRPDEIDISPVVRGTYHDLSFGVETLYRVNGAYMSWSVVEPTVFDSAKLVEACTRSRTAADDGDAAAEPSPGAQGLCQCMADQLALRQHSQADIDAITTNLADAMAPLKSSLQRSKAESEHACQLLQGLEPWPEKDSFPSRQNDTRSFYEICSRQQTIIESYRIGSPHRAMAFCGCFAEGLTRQAIDQASVDLLGALYAETISEAEFSDQAPDLLDTSDAIAERCISDLRHADYVNGVDRPGSPKPPQD